MESHTGFHLCLLTYVCLWGGFVYFSVPLSKHLFMFRERDREGEREERNINVWLPLECPALGT